MSQDKKNILSIITINRNNAKGLERTIKSVIGQSYKDYEWILIDGASTDESVDVIKRYVDNFSYWVSEKDTGVYNAMNKGIRQAKGGYCLFLNSGDMLYNNQTLQTCVPNMFHADVIAGVSIEEHTQNKFTPPGEFSPRFLLRQNISHQACFIKRELFETISLYSEDLKVLSDFEFMLKCATHGCSYERLEHIVSIVEQGGLSNTAIETMNREKTIICSRVLGDVVYHDYQYYMNKHTYGHPAIDWLLNNFLFKVVKVCYKVSHLLC